MKNLIFAVIILLNTNSYCQDYLASNDETNPNDNTVNIVKINNVYFNTNKHSLDVDSKKSLNVLLKVLIENPEMKICINAFSQDTETNSVSTKRAIEVKKYLVKNGVSANRLSTKSHVNRTFISEIDAEKIERRVEFILE